MKTGLADASAREADFVAALTHLLEGFKELKIDAAKSDDFFHNRLVPSMEAVRGLSAAVRGRYAGYYVFAHACFFVALGSVVFLLPFRGESDPFVIFKIAIVILFMIGPLEGLATTVPFLERANVAADSIERLEADLDALQPEPEPEPRAAPRRRIGASRGPARAGDFEYSDGGFDPRSSSARSISRCAPAKSSRHRRQRQRQDDVPEALAGPCRGAAC